jgi:hypothetical protein
MPLVHPTATLTIYRNGLVNLNGDATRLMHTDHLCVDLLPPARARAPWRLDRRAGSPSQLVGRSDRGHLRFRAPYRTQLLFASQPEGVDRLLFHLEADPAHPDLFTLCPGLPATLPLPQTPPQTLLQAPAVQQNPFEASELGRAAA